MPTKMLYSSKEEMIEYQIDYLKNVFNKNLSTSQEVPYSSYQYTAHVYWPEEFDKADKEGYKVEVHHINFDRSDNRLCNLVVLTEEQHKYIHSAFGDSRDYR